MSVDRRNDGYELLSCLQFAGEVAPIWLPHLVSRLSIRSDARFGDRETGAGVLFLRRLLFLCCYAAPMVVARSPDPMHAHPSPALIRCCSRCRRRRRRVLLVPCSSLASTLSLVFPDCDSDYPAQTLALIHRLSSTLTRSQSLCLPLMDTVYDSITE